MTMHITTPERVESGAGRAVGAFFLIAMAASIAGGLIVESTMGTDNTRLLVTGVLLELVNSLCVAGIGILVYPVLKDRSPAAAAGYLGFRLLEAFSCVFITIAPLAIMSLSGTNDIDLISSILIAGRTAVSNLFIPVFLAAGGFIFYSAIIGTGFLPAYLGIWGIPAAALMLILNLLLTYDIEIPGSVSIAMVAPLIVNEVYLGFRLLIRGFNNVR